MTILSDFMPFIHKVKAFPRLFFLSGIIVCWFGGALSAYANDGSCHAIYSVSPNGSTSLHVPCVMLDSTSDNTVYEFALNQVSKGEPLSFAIVNRKPTTGALHKFPLFLSSAALIAASLLALELALSCLRRSEVSALLRSRRKRRNSCRRLAVSAFLRS